MGGVAHLPERAPELSARWEALVADYDRFYAENINEILSEIPECLAKVNKKRRELDAFLEEAAASDLRSNAEAAEVLAIVLNSGLRGDATAQHRMASNVLRYLRETAKPGRP